MDIDSSELGEIYMMEGGKSTLVELDVACCYSGPRLSQAPYSVASRDRGPVSVGTGS